MLEIYYGIQSLVTTRRPDRRISNMLQLREKCLYYIQRFSGPYFPAIGLNTERFSPNAGK